MPTGQAGVRRSIRSNADRRSPRSARGYPDDVGSRGARSDVVENPLRKSPVLNLLLGNSLVQRLTRSRAQQEAHELQRENVGRACGCIADCAPGSTVTIAGTVRAMSIRPRNEAPSLEIDLYDGTGSVRIVWLGRRRILGISPGRRLIVTGRLNQVAGEPIVYNPRYELKPLAA